MEEAFDFSPHGEKKVLYSSFLLSTPQNDGIEPDDLQYVGVCVDDGWFGQPHLLSLIGL